MVQTELLLMLLGLLWMHCPLLCAGEKQQQCIYTRSSVLVEICAPLFMWLLPLSLKHTRWHPSEASCH